MTSKASFQGLATTVAENQLTVDRMMHLLKELVKTHRLERKSGKSLEDNFSKMDIAS